MNFGKLTEMTGEFVAPGKNPCTPVPGTFIRLFASVSPVGKEEQKKHLMLCAGEIET